jgi:hypothetical protein
MRLLTIILLLYGLLAASPGMALPLQLPPSASQSGNVALEKARVSFMGKDLAGKDGLMAKVTVAKDADCAIAKKFIFLSATP